VLGGRRNPVPLFFSVGGFETSQYVISEKSTEIAFKPCKYGVAVHM
jgi:hypothetical protein